MQTPPLPRQKGSHREDDGRTDPLVSLRRLHMGADQLPTLPCRLYSEGPLGFERSMLKPVTMLSVQMCDLRSHAPASCDSLRGICFVQTLPCVYSIG